MITIYGDVILDTYIPVGFVKPSPESTGNVYKLTGGEEMYRMGGAAAVAAIMQYYSNPDLCLIAPIGVDRFGRKLENLMVEHKINHELDYIDKMQTTVKFRHICNGRLLQDRFDLQEYLPYTSDFVPTRTLVISDYGNGACHGIADTIEAWRHTSNIIVDPNPKRHWAEVYKGAHIIKCNRKEAMEQIGSHPEGWPNKYIADQFQELAKILNCILIVTNGPKDICLYLAGTTIEIGVKPVDNVLLRDVTGAGDTITAILAAEIDKNCPAEISVKAVTDALQIATKYAAEQVKHLGVTYDLTFTA